MLWQINTSISEESNLSTMKIRCVIYLATLHNIQDYNHNVATDFKYEQDFSVVNALS